MFRSKYTNYFSQKCIGLKKNDTSFFFINKRISRLKQYIKKFKNTPRFDLDCLQKRNDKLLI